METEELTLEEKCENLMNVVVESRKRFGKLCVDYERKASLMENKLLNLRIETITHCNFKAKQPLPVLNYDEMNNDVEEFTKEIEAKRKRVTNLQKQIRNVQDVVLQLKRDDIATKTRQPITAEVMLARAKNKHK